MAVDAATPSASTPASKASAAAPPTAPHWGFAQVLHALNPLQYLPVVGTIYRAITGDRIPEGLQVAGSLAVSAALSGPIGLVTSAAALMLEKATGIDPDKIAHRVAVGLGLAHDDPPVAIAAAQPTPSPSTAPSPSPKPALSETEALNEHELQRIHTAMAAYAKAAALA